MGGQDFDIRYSRQLSLKGFGPIAQEQLAKARVLVVGAGGLGCPALQYLAAAGLGEIGIVDDDTIDLSNLQRQVLYTTADVGKKKAAVAALRLLAINPEIKVTPYELRVDNGNALKLFNSYDIIVDGTDNFATRYLINDACVLLKKPLVFAAVFQYEGQLAVFNVAGVGGTSTNYRHLFSKPPSPDAAPDCNAAGVLGVLPGIMGNMQAAEVIKLITGLGEPLVNKLLVFNLLSAQSYTLTINQHPGDGNEGPQDVNTFLKTDYDFFCGVIDQQIIELDAEAFEEMMEEEHVTVIDVREVGESPKVNFEHIKLPLSSLPDEMPEFNGQKILVFCQTGRRSMQAALLIKEKLNTQQEVYSLKGGIRSL